ncbi:MAG: helix-turn-helix transcriptional regulator [Planctomycetes bacterium]|nr:helix-turn-helix transcriptional regulator [Planctomycetota bacterium]
MQRHALTRHVAYGLYRHRGPAAGTAFGDWTAAERLLDLVAEALGSAEPQVEAEPEAPPAAPEPAPVKVHTDPAETALELLEAFVAEANRAEAAKRLGYKSTSTVGRILRGERALSPELVAKIQAAFGPAPRRKAG